MRKMMATLLGAVLLGTTGCAAMHMAMETDMAAGAAFGDEAAAEAPETVGKPEVDPARESRLVIYNAVLHVVVEDIANALAGFRKAVEDMGGYMQEMTSTSITIRVPASKFRDAIATAENLGKVAKKDVKGTDVTDQVRDLTIRLDNALKLRERLLKLLAESKSVEDTLKVEKELARTTETIELHKGKLQFVMNRVSFSTLTLHLNSPLPQREVETEVPFPWVRELGRDLTRGSAGRPSGSARAWGAARFTLPTAYVRYYARYDTTRAMSAAGMLILLQRHENYQGGSLDFWLGLVRRALVANRAMALDKEQDATLRTGVPARMILGTKEIGGKKYGYLVAVIARKHHVYTFEAWGPHDQFVKDLPQLTQAVQSLRIGPWYRRLFF